MSNKLDGVRVAIPSFNEKIIEEFAEGIHKRQRSAAQ
jgi:hypothetical protein